MSLNLSASEIERAGNDVVRVARDLRSGTLPLTDAQRQLALHLAQLAQAAATLAEQARGAACSCVNAANCPVSTPPSARTPLPRPGSRALALLAETG